VIRFALSILDVPIRRGSFVHPSRSFYAVRVARVDEESLPTGHDVVDQILREHLVAQYGVRARCRPYQVFALDGAELFAAFRRPDAQVD
jgi:hypothetical protein